MYTDNAVVRLHARTKSVTGIDIDLPKKLIKRLNKFSNMVGLKSVYVNKSTNYIMKKGQIFGEIALISNVRRQASVYSKESSILAYIEREDFDRVLRHIHKQDTNKQMNILRAN